jgi:hypothetical protein
MKKIADIFIGLILSLALVSTGAGVSVLHCAHAEMGMMDEMDNEAMGCEDGASCMYLTLETLEPFSAQTASIDIAPILVPMAAILPEYFVEGKHFDARSHFPNGLLPVRPPGLILDKICIIRA